jgi:TolA-binding protein
VTITDSQRIAQLEQKIESLDQSVTDLRRSVEVLNRLIDEIRLEQLKIVVRSTGLAFAETEQGATAERLGLGSG